MKIDVLVKIAAVLTIIVILILIFIPRFEYLFNFVGCLGGCMFLMYMALQSIFPNDFKEKEKK